MILLYDVVQIPTGSYLDRMYAAEVELVPHIHLAQGRMTRLKAVQRNRARFAIILQCPPKEDASGGLIPVPAQIRDDGSPFLIPPPGTSTSFRR